MLGILRYINPIFSTILLESIQYCIPMSPFFALSHSRSANNPCANKEQSGNTLSLLNGSLILHLTPRDLEKFLHKTPMIYEDPQVICEGAPSYEYLPYPVFESEKIFDRIYQKTEKAKLKDSIAAEKIWMGIYFNKELQNGQHPKVVLKKINEEIGFGVFSANLIHGGSFVGEYTGVIRERKRKIVKDNLYCTRYTVWKMGWKKFVLDAEEKGNFTRFFNHSDQPNLSLLSVYWKGIPRMIFIALKDIEEGAQLTFDYGNLFWKECKRRPTLL